MVTRDERRIAAALVEAKRAREGARTRQAPLTSVELDDGSSSSLVETALAAGDAHQLSEVQAGQLTELAEIGDAAALEQTRLPERLDALAGSTLAGFSLALDTADRVVEARDTADAAMEAAARSERTALGLARRYGETEPDVPEEGWPVGAEWVRTVAGVPREVLVWDGTEWVHAQYLADEILVPGEDGAIRIGDSKITAPMMAAEFFESLHLRSLLIEGGRIVGVEMELQATDSWAPIYEGGPVTTATIGDFRGGAPTALAPAELVGGGARITAPAGKVVAYWTNISRTPVPGDVPRRITVRVHTTVPLTGVHLVVGTRIAAAGDFAADETRDVSIDIATGDGLGWLHVGGTSTVPATITLSDVRVESGDLAGARLTLKNVDGVPGLRVHRADGSEALSVTPQGVRAPNLPYAMAAGLVSVPHPANTAAHAGIVVTLPAGRFSEAPLPTANMFTGAGGTQKDVVRAYQATPNTITLGVWTGDNTGTNPAHTDTISWTAVQMTEGSAAG